MRFERLARLESDPIRLLEQKTFTRLLYRNRNQHRHSFYFRRLEHVRRLLRCQGKHVVWQSIRHAIGINTHVKATSKKKTLLPLSTVTLGDLLSFESSLDVLVTAAIPKAAVKATLELICREHFLPFAVAILASLSRLFVIEQKLLSEIRGAVMETKLLLNGDTPASLPTFSDRITHHDSEDVGEEVTVPYGSDETPVQRTEDFPGNGRPSSPAAQAPLQLAPQKLASRRVEKSPRARMIDISPKPSLYDLMIQHSSRAASAAVPAIRLSASVPTAPDDGLQHTCGTKRPARPMIEERENANKLESQDTHPRSMNIEHGRSNQNRHLRDSKLKSIEVTMDTEKYRESVVAGPSSESEDDDNDLDDIFDAMDA